jgi:hypothetical protein
VTPRPEFVSNATGAGIFRLIEDAGSKAPTLLLDEGDTYLKGGGQLRGILNSGWMRSGASVLRTDVGNRGARRFPTWAPKAIATIRSVADTLMDRGITIQLRRKARTEKVERFQMRDTTELAQLRRKAHRWADDNVEKLRNADPDVPAALQNRQADNWRPLLIIADAAGSKWPGLAREAALELSRTDDDDKTVELLRDTRRVFEDTGAASIGAEVLVQHLGRLEEAPWGEPGQRLSTRGLAKMLKPFGIKSEKKRGPRRYRRQDFESVWTAYLPTSGN